jgi:adenine-specific DNA-methyltransferase
MSIAQNALLQLSGRRQDLWNDFENVFPSETELVAAAIALGAEDVKPWSEPETALAVAARNSVFPKMKLALLRELILAGYDPLGEAFCALRSSEIRRESGATYTPGPIVQTMVDWAETRHKPARIVDPGAGSARFLMSAGAAFPKAELIGVDVDPLAALLARANLAVTGLADRARIIVGDYRRFSDRAAGRTRYSMRLRKSV